MNKFKLILNKVSYSFQGEVEISLRDLEVEFNHLLVIKGKIGSGKSILLKTLGGVLQPLSGQVELWNIPQNLLLKGCYIHSQAEFNFVTGSVGDELEFAGISSENFTEFLTRNVNELSGGELKKLSIMMALQSTHPVILLDEPLDMLDDIQSEAMAAYIVEHSKSRPVIVATHDDHFDSFADAVIRIDSVPEASPLDREPAAHTFNEINLEVEEVSFTIGDRCFPPVTLKSCKGQIICLSGKNGSGKTIFVKTVAGIGKWPHTGGYKWNIDRSQRGICLQFPEHMAYQETVADEIIDTAGRENLEQVLDILGWHQKAKTSPFTLSDGEKRKLYLVSLLSGNSACVFDEPFAGLDQSTVNFIVKQFYRMRNTGMSIIYTANRAKDTVYADTIIEIS